MLLTSIYFLFINIILRDTGQTRIAFFAITHNTKGITSVFPALPFNKSQLTLKKLYFKN